MTEMDLEPLPLEPLTPRESPTGVVETTMVPFLEAARGSKRKSSSVAAPRSGGRRRSSASAKRAQDKEESEEEEPSDSERGNDEDEEDDDDAGDDPPGADDNSSGADGDGNIIVLGEIRQAAVGGQTGFPGANAHGDPLFWWVRYTRQDRKGVEESWLIGSLKFTNRVRAAIWAFQAAEQLGPNFLLSRWLQEFLGFARTQTGIFVVEPPQAEDDGTIPDRTVRPVCPVRGFDPLNFNKVTTRAATIGDFRARSGHRRGTPKSIWKVELTRPNKAVDTYFMVWSAWAQSGTAALNLVEAWDTAHPNATVGTIDTLVQQVRVPSTTSVMSAADVRAMADGVNFDPPAAAAPEDLPPEI